MLIINRINMKQLFGLLMLIFAFACHEPLQVTANPDDHSATSGTLGSAKSENQLPNESRDTTRADTLSRRDSL